MPTSRDNASYCCDLLSTAGPCVAKRMFGGFGISTGGLTLALLADLGDGEKLWLKGDDAARGQYAAAGCAIFTYAMKGVPRSMNYFCAPDEAMDSPDAMRPWATLALACAVRASLGKRTVATQSVSKKSTRLSVPTTPVPTAAMPLQTLAKASGPHTGQLSQAVLARARDVAKKIAVSSTLPKVNAAKPSTKRTAALPPKTAAPRKSAKGASTASQ